ncbi:hypothetical protein BDK51DRAFT_43421 [Blyttiomyces helicus]|uniref:Uncharacterized protein n=1 Tax=Blyttiomyces helicus TaxID=388810 RepID=A0A4P9W3U0_9FUNG|nr:hypothetical protein BDK51DRAFT_43421 [Blyttiomyces helicus]|eukprot:RKO85933.1 hypothetical protein BDK51DRAFT_43421 [Blyttiomyces helicus]
MRQVPPKFMGAFTAMVHRRVNGRPALPCDGHGAGRVVLVPLAGTDRGCAVAGLLEGPLLAPRYLCLRDRVRRAPIGAANCWRRLASGGEETIADGRTDYVRPCCRAMDSGLTREPISDPRVPQGGRRDRTGLALNVFCTKFEDVQEDCAMVSEILSPGVVATPVPLLLWVDAVEHAEMAAALVPHHEFSVLEAGVVLVLVANTANGSSSGVEKHVGSGGVAVVEGYATRVRDSEALGPDVIEVLSELLGVPNDVPTVPSGVLERLSNGLLQRDRHTLPGIGDDPVALGDLKPQVGWAPSILSMISPHVQGIRVHLSVLEHLRFDVRGDGLEDLFSGLGGDGSGFSGSGSSRRVQEVGFEREIDTGLEEQQRRSLSLGSVDVVGAGLLVEALAQRSEEGPALVRWYGDVAVRELVLAIAVNDFGAFVLGGGGGSNCVRPLSLSGFDDSPAIVVIASGAGLW